MRANLKDSRLVTNFNHMQYTIVLNVAIVVAMVFTMSLIAGISVASADNHRSHDERGVRSERTERPDRGSTRSARAYRCVDGTQTSACTQEDPVEE